MMYKIYGRFVKGISCDTRSLKRGDAFFAISGSNYEGNDFIEQALSSGASVVFTDNKTKQGKNIIYLPKIRLKLAKAASVIYHKLPQKLIAVTGTNGKTSVTNYVYQIISKLGKNVASIGTLGLQAEESVLEKMNLYFEKYSSCTTPSAIEFRKMIHYLAEFGVDYVVFESSSHGLHQYRLGDIKSDTAAFTSFSIDHLDYHKNLSNYLAAKLSLFKNNLVSGSEVVLFDEIYFIDKVRKYFSLYNINYSLIGRSNDYCKITNIIQDINGQIAKFSIDGRNFEFKTDIIGSFQVNNILIAMKLVNNLGFDILSILPILSQLKPVPGRLQRVTHPEFKFHIFVDYAHTPDALEKVLIELKKIKNIDSKLIVVFGCGGDRDKIKRPMMGNVAANIADIIVVTDDNPRFEDKAKIRKEILYGINNKNIIVKEIEDRALAIKYAVDLLREDDILLVAGKGNECYQIIGDRLIEFSDVCVIKELFSMK